MPTTNLLLTPLSVEEVASVLSETEGTCMLPPLGAPEWAAAAKHPAGKKWLGPLVERAVGEADAPMPELTEELYTCFHRTGERLSFERPYFERRRRLGRAALGLLLGNPGSQPALRASVVRKLQEIMSESSWALPACVGHSPTGKDPDIIDLFAAECANTLAELVFVLGSVIPEKLKSAILARLRNGIFQNFLHRHYFWMDVSNNWNAVCHQGIVGAALTIEKDHELVARILQKAVSRLGHFLEGFGEDGSTSEGPGYWVYGFGWFSELNAQLERRTQGRLSLFEGLDKIRRIARFAPLMTFSGGHLVNFSDGHRTGRLNPALLAYLGQRLGDPLLAQQANALYQHYADTGLNLEDMRSDFFRLSRLALRAPDLESLREDADFTPRDVYFENYGAIVSCRRDSRGNVWEFAAKAGHNDEHHNHNDCGSFILNINSEPLFVEIGAPEYTKSFFSLPERYEHIAARSLGHSVPFVNGFEQAAGRQFKASVIESAFHHQGVSFKIDLTECYPTEAGCRKVLRTFLMDRQAGFLRITDAVEFQQSGTFESIIISAAEIAVAGGEGIVASKTPCRILPGQGSRLLSVEPLRYNGHTGAEEKVWRLRLGPEIPHVQAAVISYEIRIA
jgi:hypothetical protein